MRGDGRDARELELDAEGERRDDCEEKRAEHLSATRARKPDHKVSIECVGMQSSKGARVVEVSNFKFK